METARGDVLQANLEVHHQQSEGQHANGRSQQAKRYCMRCGKANCRNKCPAMGKTCSSCGKANYFPAVCRSKAHKKLNSVNASDSLMHVDAPAHSMDSILAMKVNGKEVLMQIDTGAGASLISEKIWRSLGSPPLRQSNRLFSAYDGHRMKPLGELICELS